ncbi:MAG: ISAzo13-like element transposase-related protein, partial [Bacteroidota bacterium]
MQDATAGDPISGLKWTRKTTRKLAKELKDKDFQVGHSTIPRLVRKLRYTLRSNQKRLSRKQDERRDEQMRHLIRMRKRFLKRKWPVLSIDCKKKELIGQFRNPGRTWRQQPIPVLETDFPSDAKGKAVPYGIYDVGYNEGYMVVGVSHETAEFVRNAIQRWWLVVCWLNNARNSLPGLAEHGSVGHLPKMGDEPCVVASQRNFS